jgi:hypothetical protein
VIVAASTDVTALPIARRDVAPERHCAHVERDRYRHRRAGTHAHLLRRRRVAERLHAQRVTADRHAHHQEITGCVRQALAVRADQLDLRVRHRPVRDRLDYAAPYGARVLCMHYARRCQRQQRNDERSMHQCAAYLIHSGPPVILSPSV